jgi:hypothetical protein
MQSCVFLLASPGLSTPSGTTSRSGGHVNHATDDRHATGHAGMSPSASGRTSSADSPSSSELGHASPAHDWSVSAESEQRGSVSPLLTAYLPRLHQQTHLLSRPLLLHRLPVLIGTPWSLVCMIAPGILRSALMVQLLI